MDMHFEERLNELKSDGLLDNTIVFFFADHGTGMPRAKRALYDSGLKIPLLVYIPDKYADRFHMQPGTENNRMVSFLDFAPTILKIAGVRFRIIRTVNHLFQMKKCPPRILFLVHRTGWMRLLKWPGQCGQSDFGTSGILSHIHRCFSPIFTATNRKL